MIEIIVKRPPGDRPGQAITDPLLTCEHAALARGTGEIDESYPAARKTVTLRCPWIAYRRPGLIGRIQIGTIVMVGMVKSFHRVTRIDGNKFTVDTTLTLEVIDVQ
jgi:hypothetical protein